MEDEKSLFIMSHTELVGEVLRLRMLLADINEANKQHEKDLNKIISILE